MAKNEIFSKFGANRVELDDTYSLIPDSDSGLVLVWEEERTRKKVDKTTKKPTGEEEVYKAKVQYYYPTLSQVLNKYLERKTVGATSVEDLKEIVLRVEEKINSIKEKW